MKEFAQNVPHKEPSHVEANAETVVYRGGPASGLH